MYLEHQKSDFRRLNVLKTEVELKNLHKMDILNAQCLCNCTPLQSCCKYCMCVYWPVILT